MSFSNSLGISSVFLAFRTWRHSLFSGTSASRSKTLAVTVVSVTVGVAILGGLAKYFKRRKYSPGTRVWKRRTKPNVPLTVNSLDADYSGSRRSTSPNIGGALHRQGSTVSSLSAHDHPPAKLTPQQLGVMGMEALETAIRYWEDALDVYRSSGEHQAALTNEEESEFCHQLLDLHDAAFELQEKCELLFLDERSVLFRASSRSRRDSSRTCMSSAESFVSAQDEIADLKEFEEFAEDLLVDIDRLNLYQAAQKQFENEGGIPVRCLRTELVHCRSDVEFLCKLHCVRLAFQWIFKDPQNWTWFADSGRQVLIDLLLFADKDPKDFLIAYEDMLSFLQDVESWEAIEQELSQKGVKALTFYDVLLDYILMDAFDELESPPSTVTAVVQNKWLSNRFKESALTTAVWTVLKTKRRYLKYPHGFNAHFYSISEHISPLMAWGCLGPDEELKQICNYFKDQVINFLQDMFSFQSCRYTSVPELSEDILRHAKCRLENVSCRLAGNVAPPEAPRLEYPSPEL